VLKNYLFKFIFIVTDLYMGDPVVSHIIHTGIFQTIQQATLMTRQLS